MGVSRHDEVQRTFHPGSATLLPSLVGVDGVVAISQPVEQTLEAVYFDTAELDLTRRGITLDRSSGGEDAGWHLRLPAGEDTDSEVRLPLGRATKTVPASLLTPVRAVVRDRPLAPVARVSTRRRRSDIIGADAVVLAQICDDEVHAERLRGDGNLEEWREWDVRLINGTEHLLDAVEHRLVAAGASQGDYRSAPARALAEQVPDQPKPPSAKQLARGSAGQLLRAHLTEHIDELRQQDARLRADLPGSVHKLRIAARRLRSALQTYRPLFASQDTDTLDTVGDQLRWLGQALSRARDAQVLRERLADLIADEPPELVLGPVSRQIDDDLSREYHSGRRQGLEAVDTEPYFRLLDALDKLAHSPSLTTHANTAAQELLPQLLARDAKRLRQAVRRIARIDAADDRHKRDLALHEARKKAKRLRYAAESAIPVLGGRAKKLATGAQQVQEALGEHQDAVVARDKLREYGARNHRAGENGFTFGRLHAVEQFRADEAERRFEAAWRRKTRKRLDRWIQS